jgi:spore maturation protein CgeB
VLNLVTISKRRILKKISRENPRTLYSDMMKTLHEEVFYEVIYQLEEVATNSKKRSRSRGIDVYEQQHKNISTGHSWCANMFSDAFIEEKRFTKSSAGKWRDILLV